MIVSTSSIRWERKRFWSTKMGQGKKKEDKEELDPE